jgi:hypothetical protein
MTHLHRMTARVNDIYCLALKSLAGCGWFTHKMMHVTMAPAPMAHLHGMLACAPVAHRPDALKLAAERGATVFNSMDTDASDVTTMLCFACCVGPLALSHMEISL